MARPYSYPTGDADLVLERGGEHTLDRGRGCRAAEHDTVDSTHSKRKPTIGPTTTPR